MSKKKVGLWFYTNENGYVIRQQIIEKLQEQHIEVIYDFDMRECYCFNGEVYTKDDLNLSKLDAFFFMNAEERNDHQNDILKALDKSGVIISNQVESYLYANDKFTANTILRQNGINVAESMLIPFHFNQKKINKIFNRWRSVIVKPRDKICAIGIMKFDDPEKFYDFYLFAKEHVPNLYIEQYIPFEKRDTRVEIFDGKVVGEGFARIMNHSFKTNVRAGGKATFIPAEEDSKITAIAAAKALGINATIVDLVRHSETKEPYVLEVNPFLGVFYGAHFESLGERSPQHFTDIDQLKIRLIVEHILKLLSTEYQQRHEVLAKAIDG